MVHWLIPRAWILVCFVLRISHVLVITISGSQEKMSSKHPSLPLLMLTDKTFQHAKSPDLWCTQPPMR